METRALKRRREEMSEKLKSSNSSIDNANKTNAPKTRSGHRSNEVNFKEGKNKTKVF